MVRQKRLIQGVATLSLLVTCGLPAHADGESILERMQNEVASIAEKIRNAVVTIEDERTLTVTGAPLILYSPFSNIPEEIVQLETEDKQSAALLDSLQAERKRADAQFRAGLITQAETNSIDTKIRQLEIAREGLKQRLLLKRRSLSEWSTNTFRQDIAPDNTPKAVSKLRDEIAKAQATLQEYQKQFTDKHPQVISATTYLETLKRQAITQKRLFEAERKNAFTFNVQRSFPAQQHRGGSSLFVGSPQIGSGFCIGDDFIVTTSDVLAGIKNPVVVTDNGTRIKARVVGSNHDLNVGLLRLTAKTDVGSLKMGDSTSVRAGHFAISIGNQAGQPNSVTLMLVGNIRNQGTYAGNQFYPSLIQIAGTVGAGTSGAPLVNIRGEVIGMMAAIPVANSYISARTSGTNPNDPFEINFQPSQEMKILDGTLLLDNQQAKPQALDPLVNSMVFFNAPQPSVTSAGYAIPINQVKNILDELRSEKPILRGWIGVAPEDVVATIEKKGIIQIDRSVRVTAVYPDSPAFIAGIQPGDIISLLNDKPIRNAGDIRELSVRLKKGDAVSLTIRRPNETRKIVLSISARPATIKPPITTPIKESF